jgi:shikimate dehydrogenase
MSSVYGVLGKKLSHSFSKKYFENKFSELGLKDHAYSNFEFPSLKEFFASLDPEVKGFNITNPYKEEIILLLDELSEEAKTIGAVNCVKIEGKKKIGFNTDAYGFSQSIKPFLEPQHERALILGTGGAAKAVAYSLRKVGVEVYFVTSKIEKNDSRCFFYSELNEIALRSFKLIVNASPLGMFPAISEFPPIPYQFIDRSHLCYDLIYNPEKTLFLQKCSEQGAACINGLSMLHLQAEKSWEIWSKT